MTKVREKTTNEATGAAPPAQAGPTDPVGRLMERFMGVLRPRPGVVDVPAQATKGSKGAAPAAAPPARKRTPMGRFFWAMIAYVIGSILLENLLLLANAFFKLNLQKTQNLFPTSWPFVGNMTRFTLIYLLLLVALIWILYRTGVMPRDPLGTRSRDAQRTTAGNASASAGRSRSARRAAAAHAATSTPRRAASPAARTPAAAHTTGGAHDVEYNRVRALQRSRRRKR
jgi:hypothetical protein